MVGLTTGKPEGVIEVDGMMRVADMGSDVPTQRFLRFFANF